MIAFNTGPLSRHIIDTHLNACHDMNLHTVVEAPVTNDCLCYAWEETAGL
jgi:hypothetical protein